MIFQINEFHRLKFWANIRGYRKNNCKYDWLERENIDCVILINLNETLPLNWQWIKYYKWKCIRQKSALTPFVSNARFLYSLKTSENRKVFQGVEKGCIGNEWVNLTEI